MKKKFAVLQKTDWKEALTPESNGAFLYHLQRALLLALREREMLSALRVSAEYGLTETEKACVKTLANACDGHATERVCELIRSLM